MPLTVSRNDRRLLLSASAICLALIVALSVKSADQQESEIPSSYSPDSQGARAAYLLLEEQGYNVERWEQSPNALPEDVADTTLVLVSPFNAPTKEESASLQLFLSRGGRILATGSTASLFLPRADIERNGMPSPDWKEFRPGLLTPITRAGVIKMSPAAYWKNNSTSYLSHYADGDRPIVVSYKVGKGEVIWWASSIPLSNAGITAAGNLPLLLNSLAGRKHILWDEYFHGYRQSLLSYMAAPPLFFGFIQCLLLTVAVLLTYSRRSLPIHPAMEQSRLSPLEFVQTLGGLYRQARANRAALEVPYARFRTIATRHLGLAPNINAEELASALRRRLGYKDATLNELLRRIEAALTRDDLGADTALELSQELNRHMQNLKLA